MRIKALINKMYEKFILPRTISKDILYEQHSEEWLEIHTIPEERRDDLTEAEKKEVLDLWGIKPHTWREYACYKHARGFDARFMPMSIYLPLITRRLNDYKYTKFFEHKSMLGYLVKGPIKFPHCYVRVVNGEMYDNKMQQITREEAIAICLGQEKIVVKDSIDSSGGKDIDFLDFTGKSEQERRAAIEDQMEKRGTDYVIQECLVEHESLRKFNPSSINTIRVQSLYLNQKCTAVTTVIRIGAEGAKVDNVCMGGVTVGIHPDGRLYEYGFDNTALKMDRKGDFIFKDVVIEQIPALIELICDCHKKMFPLCKYIGWDIMFNENNEPVCIELNSSQNGQLGFQFTYGPTFGDRTKEVIDYCNTKPFVYGRSVFSY